MDLKQLSIEIMEMSGMGVKRTGGTHNVTRGLRVSCRQIDSLRCDYLRGDKDFTLAWAICS